ncbi:MAG: lactoylglutathione lyase [Chlorobi bacterium]|nr:lactoylglutathione lyase [Chlorobiota bacterium]
MKLIEFILYVSDQSVSKNFYEKLLNIKPSLDVPGMTEFDLSDSVKLGLMPEDGVAKILSDKTPHPAQGGGIPRCEIYLKVKNAEEYLQRGIALGGKEISAMQNRDWGDKVGYIADLDGHVLAFAESEFEE